MIMVRFLSVQNEYDINQYQLILYYYSMMMSMYGPTIWS